MESEIRNWILEMNKHGISNEHIELMKDRVMQSKSDYEFYYDKVSESKKTVCVDVNKIIGIGTDVTPYKKSIYTLFFSVFSRRTGIQRKKIMENLDSLITNGLQYQHDFYENEMTRNPPEFDYYLDDDVYFTVIDGTHRTVSAIMFGAPKMRGRVTTYKKNIDKYNNYLIHKDSVRKWKELNKKLKSISIIIHNETDISIDRFDDKYQIRLKEFPNENLYLNFYSPIVIIDNQSMVDAKRIEKEREKVDILIHKLRQIDDCLFSNSKKLGILPLPLCLKKKIKFRLGSRLLEKLYKNNQSLKM
ncbi:hypothetical protein ACS2MN_15540 [Bacillus cereus group sp. BceL062]|uniref:hypothetical protein n=1 Tax=Bacillus cereus group TaxID=86661 RepID=UPI0032194E03